jgi:hypothetical protein
VSAQGRTAHVLAPTTRREPAIRYPLKAPLKAIAVVAVAAIALLTFFLAIYKVKSYAMPIGYDTPRYLFQTTLVGDLGLSNVPHVLPPPKKSLATRTGFPVVVLTLSKLFSASTFTVAGLVPPAAAVSLALAAGAFVSWGLRRSAWELAAVTVIVGTSALMIRLLVPETYIDNLMSAAILVAALVPIVSAIRQGPGTASAVILLALAGAIHPQFFALFGVILGLVALAYAPSSWRAWRRDGVRLLDTPAVRLVVILAGAALLAAAILLAAIRSWPVGVKQTRHDLLFKLAEDLPLYRFPLTVPIAMTGLAFLAALGLRRSRPTSATGDSDPRSRAAFVARFLLVLSVVWGMLTLAGVIDFYSGSTTAAHRLLSFLLPFPLVIAIGILGLGWAISMRAHKIVGVAVVLAGIAVVGFLGYRDLYVNLPAKRGIEFLDVGKVRDATEAVAYLQRSVPPSRPVVFVIDDRGPNPLSWVPEMAYMIRSVLPPERILNSYMYVGDPDNYLEGKPTLRSDPRQYNGNLPRYWPTIQRILPHQPVALLLSSYNDAYPSFVASHPGSLVAPNVAVVSGPRPRALVEPGPFPRGPRGVVPTGVLGVGTLAVLVLIGMGWALVALPRGLRPFELVALSPAIGIAALVGAGIVVDAVGLRLSGPGGFLAPILAALAGGIVAWIVSRRRSAQAVIV